MQRSLDSSLRSAWHQHVISRGLADPEVEHPVSPPRGRDTERGAYSHSLTFDASVSVMPGTAATSSNVASRTPCTDPNCLISI